MIEIRTVLALKSGGILPRWNLALQKMGNFKLAKGDV